MNTLSNLSASFPDDRDYPYLPVQTPLLTSIDLKPDVFEIEDQGTIGSCTANATISCLEHMLKGAGRPLSLSRLFNYYQSRVVIEGQTGEGANLRDAVRAAYHFGTPTEAIYPYDILKENTIPPATVYTEAATRVVTRYERLSFGMYDDRVTPIKSALNEGLPVIFAIGLMNDFFNLKNQKDWKTQVYNDAYSASNPLAGNHAMLIVGYDDTLKRFLVENSWGPAWGDGGFLGLGYSQIQNDAFEAWVVRGFNGVEVNQPVQPPASPITVTVSPTPLQKVLPVGQTFSVIVSNMSISGGVPPYTIAVNGKTYPQSQFAIPFQNTSVHTFTTDTKFIDTVPNVITDMRGNTTTVTLKYKHSIGTPIIDHVATAEENTTQSLYLAYLGRPADLGGMNFWAPILKTNGADFVRKFITDNPEYNNKYKTVSQNQIDAANLITFG